MNQPPKIDIMSAFACPFVVRQMDNFDNLNQELKSLFLQKESEGDAHTEAVPTLTLKVKTFESTFDLFKWSDPCVQELCNFCYQSLAQAIVEVNGVSPRDVVRFQVSSHAWFHITRHSGYMGVHNHPMASWSGVYVVDPGEPDPENPDSGNLRFYDPRNSVNMFMDVGNSHLVQPYSAGVQVFQPMAGRLVMFPSYLMHDVAPFTGNGTRIVVAFNAWMNDPGQKPQSHY